MVAAQGKCMSKTLSHLLKQPSRGDKSSGHHSGLDVYRRLLGYVRAYWYVFIVGIIATALASGVAVLLPWSLDPILEKGFIVRDQTFIKWLPLWLMALFLARGAATFASTYCITWIGRNVVMRMRQDIMNHLLHLPARFYDYTASGTLLSALIFNVEQLTKASTSALVVIVQEGCLVIGLITLMFVKSWQLAVLFVVAAPVIAVVVRYSNRRMRYLNHRVQDTMAEVTHQAEECFEGYKVIRSFGNESYEKDRFRRVTQRYRHQEMKVLVTNALSVPAVQLILALVIAATIYIATLPTTALTAGAFVAMITAMLQILKPMRSLTTINNDIQRGIAAADSIFNLLDEPVEQDHGTQMITRTQGLIEFSHVRFNYNRQGSESSKDVLQDVSFQVKPGQKVAFVGRSGSGKTTLVSLLTRLYEYNDGVICLDGIPIRDLTLKNLRQQFATVSQHVVLFNDTVARNITYGMADCVTDEQRDTAARAAYAMEFIDQLPDKMDTLIGENGVQLSGGQRQRIAIARALLKDSPILILDEATSSLDTESERAIQRALDHLMKDRTTLIVAHRLSTIENADHIIVLDQGRVVEQGTHQQLLSQEGHYATLHAMQFNDDAEFSSENHELTTS